MQRATFVKLAALALGLLLSSFVLMGLSRLVVSTRTAQLVSAPTMIMAAVLVVFLTVRSALAVSGLRPLED